MEQWQTNFKKQQMRENIVESLRLREAKDREMSNDVLGKEAKLNRQQVDPEAYQPSVSKPLNIYDNNVQRIGQHHLTNMHKTVEK